MNIIKVASFWIAFVLHFSLVNLQCNDFVVTNNGVEYLRLNGTNNLWACSTTNICDRISQVEQKVDKGNDSNFVSCLQQYLQQYLKLPQQFKIMETQC